MAKQKPHRWFTHGFVYFIVCDELHVVKIGHNNRWLPPGTASGDPIFARHRRLRELQTGCPASLRIAGMVEPRLWGTEDQFHRYFQHFRKHGEWFWQVGQLATFVQKLEQYRHDVLDVARRSEAGEKGLVSPQPPFLDLQTPCIPNEPLPQGWQIIPGQ